MAQDLGLLQDLAVVLVTAGVVALAFHKLKLPPVLGYLVAGVLVGPHVSPVDLVRNVKDIEVLAQLGIIFLLFGLGLDFHLGRLRRVGGLALTAGVLETSLMVGVGFVAGSLFGWRLTDALVLGTILAISSTTLVVKVLSDLGRTNEPSSEAIFGILLVEDLVAVLLIALLSSLAISGGITVVGVAALALRVSIFVVAVLVVGLAIVPRLVDHVATLRVEALLVLLAVGFAFATSMIAVALGLSLALGAFIAGAVVAESRASAAVEHRIAPLRDLFGAVFFVSTGILLNPADLVTYWPAIVILGIVSILGKMIAVGLATFVAGYPPSQALRVGIGMAMIGEFSFVIAAQGADLGVTSAFLLPIAVSVSALTTLVTPPLIRNSETIVAGIARAMPSAAREYLSMYSAWSQNARRRRQSGEAYRGGLRGADVARVGVYALLLASAGIGAAYVDHWLGSRSVDADLRIASLAIFAIVGIAIVLGLVSSVRGLVRHLSEAIIPPDQSQTAQGLAAARVLRRTLYVFLALLVGVVLVAAGAAFAPPLPLVLAAALIVAVALVFLGGSVRKLNTQMEQALETVLSGGGDAPGTRDQLLTVIREQAPWDMHAQSVIVPAGSRAAGRRIRDLQLPQKTGASIVTHERAGRAVLNPQPDLLIEPGDVVGVLGDKEQVELARRLLTGEPSISQRPSGAASAGVRVEEMEVRHGSSLSGLTLAGSRIRETTGASVVGLRRGGVPILNPAPVLRLSPGDTVVLLGTPEQVEAARSLFDVR